MNALPIVSVLVFTLGLSMAGPTWAVPIVTKSSNNTSQTYFDFNISTSDLIQNGAPSLGSVAASHSGIFHFSGANNGSAAQTSGLSYWGNNTGLVTLTYNLTGSATGYDITSVNSIYGWQDSRYRHAAQRYEVLVQTVSNSGFTQIAAVDYHPWAYTPVLQGSVGSSEVTITDSVGLLATGVTAIQFLLHPYMTIGEPGYTGEIGVIRELDVFGTASVAAVPEPGTLALLGLAFAGLLVSRRKAV